MRYFSSKLLEDCSLNIGTPCLKGNDPLLELCIANLIRILLIYVAWDKPNILFQRSRKIWIPKIYLASPKSFISKWFINQIYTVDNVTTSLMSRISSTYKIKNITMLCSHFLYTHGPSIFCSKLKNLITWSKWMF